MVAMAKKIQVGAAALAVVAVAGFTPVIAQADETSDSDSSSVGTSAGKAPTRGTRGNKSTPSANTSTPSDSSTTADTSSTADTSAANQTANATGSNPLFQNPLIWIGRPNPNPPASQTITEFEPLGELPEFTRPMFGWMQDFEFEACVLGLSTVNQGQSVQVGPYGTSTTSFSGSGCA